MRGVIPRKEINNFPFKAILNSFFEGIFGFAVFFIVSSFTRLLHSIFYNTNSMQIELWDFILGFFCFALVFSFKFLERYNKKS